VLPPEEAAAYCARLQATAGQPAWIVGDVVAGACACVRGSVSLGRAQWVLRLRVCGR
jgi:hypothetical protein